VNLDKRKKRTICVFTGTRAEYGLLNPLMEKIKGDPFFDLQIIVSGTHLSPVFGNTVKQIENDGFCVDWKVHMLVSGDTAATITKSMGLELIGMADALEKLQPDILIVLGDRYEALIAAQAALIFRIPIAHIHGGEITEGAFDDSIRHAITKMASLHFTSTERYRQRVIQLGEDPGKVFNVGALGLDNIGKLHLLCRRELEKELDFGFGQINFLVTYHPETLSASDVSESLHEVFKALGSFENVNILFTKANSDVGGFLINEQIERYCHLHPKRMKLFDSLGQIKYLSCLKYVDLVIGNSSSGIIEVPMFKKPTVNIGNRQGGRLRSNSVIDSSCKASEIVRAIRLALSSSFQEKIKNCVSPYGDGNASSLIMNILKNFTLEDLKIKKFYDVTFHMIDGKR